MKVLIGGGTGFIGRNLHKILKSRGHTVTLISRNPGRDRVTWKELENENSLPECDAVVNLSGEYILSPLRRWNESYKKDIYDSRIKTNNAIVKLMIEGNAFRESKCKTLLAFMKVTPSRQIHVENPRTLL